MMNESKIFASTLAGKYLYELQSRSQKTVVVEAGFVMLINLVSLVGNSIICWAMFRNARLHTTANFYILSLAIADAFMALLVMPISFGVLVTSRWPFGSLFCSVQGSVVLILAFVSSTTVSLMALNRYFRVVRPSSYRTWFTVNKSMSMLLAVWGIVILLVLLPVVGEWASFDFYPQRCNCFIKFTLQDINKTFTALHLIMFVVLPMIVIIVCYAKVFITVKRHSTVVFPTLQNNRHPSGGTVMTVEEIKLTRLLLAIVLGFMVCWIPVLIIECVNTSLHEPGSLPRWVYLVYMYLWYTSAAINPIIYGALNRTFRLEAMRAFYKTKETRTQFDEHNL